MRERGANTKGTTTTPIDRGRAIIVLATTLWMVVLAAPASGSAQERAEKFVYDVTWANARVAKMKLQRGCPRKGYVPMALSATSRGVAEQLHEFTVRLDSFGTTEGRPLEGRTFIREEGVPRVFKTRFHTDGEAVVRKTFKNKEKTLRLDFDGRTDDLLSWWYALRRVNELEEGDAHSYWVWDGWKLVRLVASVGRKERVWTPAGTYEAFRVKLKRTRIHHRGKQAYEPKSKTERLGVMWLADDPARTPIAMDFDAPVGVARIRLTRAVVSACK